MIQAAPCQHRDCEPPGFIEGFAGVCRWSIANTPGALLCRVFDLWYRLHIAMASDGGAHAAIHLKASYASLLALVSYMISLNPLEAFLFVPTALLLLLPKSVLKVIGDLVSKVASALFGEQPCFQQRGKLQDRCLHTIFELFDLVCAIDASRSVHLAWEKLPC